MTRLMITLNKEERLALGVLAKKELRDPREQIRYIVVQELMRLGLLPVEEAEKSTTDLDDEFM